MPKVVVVTHENESVEVFGPYNSEQAERKIEEWQRHNATVGSSMTTSYFVCDLL